MKQAVSLLLFVLIISCTTDYDGPAPEEEITIGFASSDTILTNTAVTVDWGGMIGDTNDLFFFYCISTDTSVTAITAHDSLSGDKWTMVKGTSASLYFPAVPLNSEEIFYKDTVVQDTVTVNAVWSKLFLYAENEVGIKTPVVQRFFLRYNAAPGLTKLSSNLLKLVNERGGSYLTTTDVDALILPSSHPKHQPIDFSWTAADPDHDPSLMYKWELYEVTGDGDILVQSVDWVTKTGVFINDEIYDHKPEARYRFDVQVRDDALEVSDKKFSLGFLTYEPTFDKGILFIDDTDPELYFPPDTAPTDIRIMGNPNPVQATAHYDEILRYAGYLPEGEATDSLSLYRITKFEKGGQFVYWDYIWFDEDGDPSTPDIIVDSVGAYIGVYKPRLRELLQYRLVVMASDDRSNYRGVDFSGTPPYSGYAELLSDHLDLGGKQFILGPSVLMGKIYTTPAQLPVHEYKDPFTYVFDGETVSGQGTNGNTEEFFRDYFGISDMTFPEQKTAYVEDVPHPVLQFADYKYSDNHDFIGSDPINAGFSELKIDSVRVNDAFFNRKKTVMTYRYALKDNGTVFTGVPSFSISKGEEIFRYRSLYDLPVSDYNDSLAFEISGTDTIFHKLYWEDVETGETGPVLHRSGTLASRYAEENGQFKTAFFGIPSFFMDNSADQVSDMFKAMVDWFDLSVDPSVNWKKK
ncbi:MAG: hypothetical protein RBS89_01045 [Candidatus Delongbacteria bacterium]|jgi:hypothetical protein|nr:hypothetical protein [Candidatus Delongbacteria bacterium]